MAGTEKLGTPVPGSLVASGGKTVGPKTQVSSPVRISGTQTVSGSTTVAGG